MRIADVREDETLQTQSPPTFATVTREPKTTEPKTTEPKTTEQKTTESAIDEVIACAHAYEQALIDGDGAAAAAFFADADDVSRFGPEGAQLGRQAVVALRTSYSPMVTPVWLDEQARLLAPGLIVHLAVLQRSGVTVQRTQVWKHDGSAWRIHHAHVSRLADPQVPS